MFLYVGKLLSALATPIVLAIVALIIAAASGSRRVPRAIAVLSALLLFVCSSPQFSNLLVRTLEQPYSGTDVASAPTAQAIVVSGGYLRIEMGIPRHIEIGSTADRLLCAAELYRAAKAPLILLSGGNISFLTSSDTPAEAVAARDILEQWGIPRSAILVEGQSQSTHENAEFSHRILDEHGITRILLVTSALHMRRASATFRRAGLTVSPFAADFLGQSASSDLVLSLIPSAGALVDTGSAIKEWSGYFVYRLRGWTA